MTSDKNDLICPGFSSYKDAQLSMQLSKENDVIIVKLDGYIDTYNSKYFNVQMEKLSGVSKKIIIDFSSIDYMSSAGIGALVEANKNSHVVMLGIQPKVREVLHLLGFEKLMEITYNLEDALKLVNTKKEAPFPRIIVCPSCKSKLKTHKPGQFRCPKCKTILSVDNEGKTKVYSVG